MAVRKEQVVFALAAVVVGLLVWSGTRGGTALRSRSSRGQRPELVRLPAPDPERVLPRGPGGAPERDLFSQPSNTRPLPPLALEVPPRADLAAIFPPPEDGPAPAQLGRFLRRLPLAVEVPDLFAAAEEPELADAEELDRELETGSARPTDPRDAVIPGIGSAKKEKPVESADQRAARLESYRQIFDWIQLSEIDVLFGSIEGEDPIGLLDPARQAEAVPFREFDPESGAPRFPGQPAVAFERARVRALGFADTVPNRLELRRRALGPKITRGNYAAGLGLAEDCVASRLEAPRALATAEELFTLLAGFDPQDPAPRLGLARCHEAGFEFERARAEYLDLARLFDHHAEVHARLAQLQERFLLFEQAEQSYRRAIARERGSFEANLSFGRFLLARGRVAEALPLLRRADQAAPQDPESIGERVAARVELGRGLIAAGELPEARASYESALHADPRNPEALAGWIALALVERGGSLPAGAPLAEIGSVAGLSWLDPAAEASGDSLGAAEAAAVAEVPDLGFELLLSGGLWSLARGEWRLARERLEAAAAADPLRAAHAWRALSWLAESTGYPEEAERFAEMAFEAEPGDPWVLLQRGRLLAARDDEQGAVESFEAASARDAGFDAPLAAIGELYFRRGRHAEAERYLDQALRLSPGWAEVHALRGLNLLAMGEIGGARASFEAARGLAPEDPLPAEGLAWCSYREGQPEEARILLAQVDDRRRGLPEDDPHRAWARRQIARIGEHLEQTLWTDRFERTVLKNGWITDEGAGPLVGLVDGAVKIEGSFKQKGSVRLFQAFTSGGQFVALEASVLVEPETFARGGLFLARERERRGATEVQDEVRVSRHPEGQLQVRVQRSGESAAPEVDLVGVSFPTGRWVRLRFEVTGERTDPRLSILVDGIPVREGLQVPGLFRSSSEIRAGLFVEGDIGRKALVRMDDVEAIYRVP